MGYNIEVKGGQQCEINAKTTIGSNLDHALVAINFPDEVKSEDSCGNKEYLYKNKKKRIFVEQIIHYGICFGDVSIIDIFESEDYINNICN